MRHDQVEYVKAAANDALIQINNAVIDGVMFADAKSSVIRSVMSAQKHVANDTANALRFVLKDIEVQDLEKVTMNSIGSRNISSIEQETGRKMGKIERWIYDRTGWVWRV